MIDTTLRKEISPLSLSGQGLGLLQQARAGTPNGAPSFRPPSPGGPVKRGMLFTAPCVQAARAGREILNSAHWVHGSFKVIRGLLSQLQTTFLSYRNLFETDVFPLG